MLASRTDLGHGLWRHTPLAGPASAAWASDGSWEKLTEKCLELCLERGFVRAKVAGIAPFPDVAARLESYLEEGYAGTMDYLGHRQTDGTLTRSDPAFLFAEAKSALCVALAYPSPSLIQLRRARVSPGPSLDPAAPLLGGIASYAKALDYHVILKEMLLDVGDELAGILGQELKSRVVVDSAPLLERDLARRAGLSFTGKNTLAIAPGAGSHFVLGELLLDVPLVPSDKAVAEGCGSCTACITACPTNAFVREGLLDARKCISYLTIESAQDIPRALRPLMGNWVFGCDLCQSVCPYNQGSSARKPTPHLAPTEALKEVGLVELLFLTSGGYKRLVRGTPLRRASRAMLGRNAAVALGNSGSESAVAPLLKAALEHTYSQVRAHAMWGLLHLERECGLESARLAVEDCRNSVDPTIQGEIADFCSE